MYPPFEHTYHTYYAWLIIIALVCAVSFVGAMLWRVRLLRANRIVNRVGRGRACIKD